jgi:hypothetical protein
VKDDLSEDLIEALRQLRDGELAGEYVPSEEDLRWARSFILSVDERERGR